jgi:hypothetical protein
MSAPGNFYQGSYRLLKNSGSIAAFYDDIVFWDLAAGKNKYFVTFMKGVYGFPNNGQESIGTMEIDRPHYFNTSGSTASFANQGNRVSARFDAFLDEFETTNKPTSANHQYNGSIPVTQLKGNRYYATTITSSIAAVRTYDYEHYEGTTSHPTTRTFSSSYFYPFSSHQLGVLRIEPTIIINLNKESEMYDGLGEKGFVVVPEQTHQKVKDNLNYYLEKAGLVTKTTRHKRPTRPNQGRAPVRNVRNVSRDNRSNRSDRNDRSRD